MSGFTFYAAKPIENYHKIDTWLLISMVLLWGFGIFTLFVSTQNFGTKMFNDPLVFVKRQLICSAVGFAAFIFLLVCNIKFIRDMMPVILIGTIVLCLLTFIPAFSIEKNGARRWLKLPAGFNLQPSEIVKFSMVLFMANFFDKQEKLENPEEKNVLPCVIVFVILCLLVFLQKDLSTGIFIMLIGLSLFFVSGSKMKWLIPFFIIAIPALFLMISMNQFRLQRVLGWIRPDEYATTVSYQSLAAKRAISAGGLWGNGIGIGLYRINSIPEIQSDYIFAGWAEAMGFIGVLGYFLLLVFFAWRGYRTAFICPDRFTSYATFGCVSLIVLQSLINTLVVSGLLPSTGITLPFFSLGGSSIMITLAMCGFILNASRCEKIEEKTDDNNIIDLENLTYL